MLSFIASFLMTTAPPDPRVTCARELEVERPMLADLRDRGILSPIEVEHTAVVSGSMLEKYRGVRTLVPRRLALNLWGEDVLVVVKPSGESLVFAVAPNGDLRSRGPRADRLVRVPDFQNVLRAGAGRRWSWEKEPPEAIELGDVSKSDFMGRYEATLKDLVRRDELNLDNLLRARVLRGYYRVRPLEILMFPIPERYLTGIVVLDVATGEKTSAEPKIARREFIQLENRHRLGMTEEGGWVLLPPPDWMHDPEYVGGEPSTLAFVEKYPRALDDLLFRDDVNHDIDHVNSRVISAVDEVNHEDFAVLQALGAGGEPIYFVYDPRAREWVDESTFGTRTFSLGDGRRLGVNIDGETYRLLPPPGAYDRARAHFALDERGGAL